MEDYTEDTSEGMSKEEKEQDEVLTKTHRTIRNLMTEEKVEGILITVRNFGERTGAMTSCMTSDPFVVNALADSLVKLLTSNPILLIGVISKIRGIVEE